MDIRLRSKAKWRSLLNKEDYNTLVTIQRPMKNRYMMEGNMENFFNLKRVNSLFYSVEKNADRQGYHIHLMFDGFKWTKEHLAQVLDVKQDYIPYYEPISDKVAVNRYVTKYMNGDQIHYNFYKK
jgi:hypothetical protein